MGINLLDGWQYIRKLSIAKIFNIVQLILSYYLAKFSGKVIHWGMPTSISFEPTTACNLRCPECPSGLRSFTRPTGMLKNDLFLKTIDELAPRLTYLIFYFQGEPFLNPQFLEMVKYASKKKIYTATSTNAHFLNDEVAKKTVESGLDRLIISIDGTTQETYESYRIGGKLNKVIEGTKNIIKWKRVLRSSTPHVMFQFLVVRPNEHQIREIKELAKELEVDEVVLKTAQIYDYENGSDLIPVQDKYSRYEKMSDGSYKIKNKLVNSCWKMWNSCVITWNGLVVPCCFDKDAHHKLGSMKQTTFTELWRGEKYNNFRKALLKGRSKIEICKNCTEGTKVWA